MHVEHLVAHVGAGAGLNSGLPGVTHSEAQLRAPNPRWWLFLESNDHWANWTVSVNRRRAEAKTLSETPVDPQVKSFNIDSKWLALDAVSAIGQHPNTFQHRLFHLVTLVTLVWETWTMLHHAPAFVGPMRLKVIESPIRGDICSPRRSRLHEA